MATHQVDTKGIWDYLYNCIGNEYGVAGLMGNLYAESALISINMQNSYESKLGYTDTTYTAAVDSGKYTSFANDGVGYGLAQWTYKTRKANLLAYAKACGTSIGDCNMQLSFLYEEMRDEYKSVLTALKNASSVREASDVVLKKYECPADQSTSVQARRAEYGQEYYNAYAGNAAPTVTEVRAENPADYYDSALAGTYKVNADSGLNIREGAGTNHEKLVAIPNGTSVANYGYYSKASDGEIWLYVQFTYENVKYTGFGCKQYLSK